jgi:site-specific recombinase XerD
VRGSIACPVAAVRVAPCGCRQYRPAIPINQEGRDRLTAQSVADIVKVHAERAGLDPAAFAGHSLRAGFLTSAAKKGANIFKMMDVSGHRSLDTLRGYVRDAELFQDHAGAGLL